MRNVLLRSGAFINAARKLVKQDPYLAEEIKNALELLSEDMFSSRLKTHKLKGSLRGSMACSVNYSIRIVFKIVQYQDAHAILLETIGTHDEIY
jgi:mRNA interferase YafQ